MTHLFLGSIGVLAETSDLQRQAFNDAFAATGLDWYWSRADYARMLKRAGGQARIAEFAAARNVTVDVAALHELKSTLFQARLDAGVSLRPGVAETMASIRAAGGSLALVTSTLEASVRAVLAATRLSVADFDLILHAGMVAHPKPAPDAYLMALEELGCAPSEVLVVEDNPDGHRAALSAGLSVLAFPGAFHGDAAFPGALAVQSRLTVNAASYAA